jgi:putative SOS response-associated peptidase YedK
MNILNSNANNDIKFHCVSKEVNNPSNNNPSLINKVNFL